jgi:glycosidase
MLKYWIREADVDGFRCDVAYMVPTDFWEQARAELTKVKPDIMMLAEASKPELLVKAFDIDYSWPFHATLNDVLLRGAPASKLRDSWEDSRRQFPQGSLHLRISDNHDEARAVARFGFNGALAAQALMFTLDGVPLVYNGMEAGDATESGDPALFDKLNIFWSPKERPQLRSIYTDLIKLRKDYPAFRNDKVTWLQNSDANNVVTFLRADDKDEFLIIINFCNRPVYAKLDLKDTQGFTQMKISGQPAAGNGALPNLHLNGFEWRIYHRAVNAMAAK